jgi:2-oxo-4-hydroxy-4-carboxy--5-ureidoimidazoline (OHCU) decarboxylase
VTLTKDARKERAEILREASSLRGLLATLKDIIAEAEHDPQDQWLRATANLATPGGPLNQCELAFQALLKLTPGHGIREAFQRITWKFSKEEVDELLSQIERVKKLRTDTCNSNRSKDSSNRYCWFKIKHYDAHENHFRHQERHDSLAG